jgi:hypothetical protein
VLELEDDGFVTVYPRVDETTEAKDSEPAAEPAPEAAAEDGVTLAWGEIWDNPFGSVGSTRMAWLLPWN